MKKWIVLFLLVCVLVIPVSTGLAMTQSELQDYREEAQVMLNDAQEVSWHELNDNQDSYSGQVVKFKGKCVGQQNSVGFKDNDGNLFVISNPLPYRFKLGTVYTISATFTQMVDDPDGGPDRAAVFSLEQTHLPVMSEYGL